MRRCEIFLMTDASKMEAKLRELEEKKKEFTTPVFIKIELDE